MKINKSVSQYSRIMGCFFGGAIGDALGAPIEFMDWDSIREEYGETGIQDYAEAFGRRGAITDDTQMSLFTAEGLIRAQNRWEAKGICHPPSIIKHAYLRWLLTQGEKSPSLSYRESVINNGWLITNKELHHQRAPGTTVMNELLNPDRDIHKFAENDRKGCGGVMRVAPIGLSANDPFGLAADAAHFTHGHPTGFLSAGAFSLIINGIINGNSIDESIQRTLPVLRDYPDHIETLSAIEQAVNLAKTSPLAPENIEQLGGGWLAEEALAISLFCALKAEDFSSGVLAAVNHSGDSDSTGSMCGNILGTLMGVGAIPEKWIEELEVRDVIEQLAHDFINTFICDDDKAICNTDRYPCG